MCLNGKCFGERESVSKKGWGHISCKCSQMLVKVHQLCICDWKNLFLESLQTPEAWATMLPSCLIYLCVCGLEQCIKSWNEKSPKEIGLRHIHCSAGVSVHFECAVSIPLFMVGVFSCCELWELFPLNDEVLQSCVALPSVRVIRWYVATENNCWVCLCGAAAFVQ